jgi:hypothetical protein
MESSPDQLQGRPNHAISADDFPDRLPYPKTKDNRSRKTQMQVALPPNRVDSVGNGFSSDFDGQGIDISQSTEGINQTHLEGR